MYNVFRAESYISLSYWIIMRMHYSIIILEHPAKSVHSYWHRHRHGPRDRFLIQFAKRVAIYAERKSAGKARGAEDRRGERRGCIQRHVRAVTRHDECGFRDERNWCVVDYYGLGVARNRDLVDKLLENWYSCTEGKERIEQIILSALPRLLR